LLEVRLTPHNEAPAVKNANVEYARFAFVVTIENGSYRKGAPAEAQAMRLGSASA
jgi:hypothetical protein